MKYSTQRASPTMTPMTAAKTSARIGSASASRKISIDEQHAHEADGERRGQQVDVEAVDDGVEAERRRGT